MVKVGQKLTRGDMIGYMGQSGQCVGIHLHLDVVEGQHTREYKQREIEDGVPKAAPLREVNYFVDKELFGVEPVVTVHIGDPAYMAKSGKVHFHYDVVPEDRHQSTEHYIIYWNRSKVGTVVAVNQDPAAYGNCVHVVYDT
jgi:murein DD-endopeptidase MepM/ murein hydrolase activator NlpD